MKCPICSGTKWSSSPEIVASKGLPKLTIEDIKKPISKKVEKRLVEEFKRIMKLQAQVKYTCKSCGWVSGNEKIGE